METQIFHHAKKKKIFTRSSKKKPKILQRYYNSITNLKFQHKPKNIIFQKSLYKNRPITVGCQNPLSYYYILYNESKTQYKANKPLGEKIKVDMTKVSISTHKRKKLFCDG
jgi:hypothetical protein